jgi:hypothetical protein
MADKSKSKPIDLAEYEEQVVPFDDVIRKIAKPKKPKK